MRKKSGMILTVAAAALATGLGVTAMAAGGKDDGPGRHGMRMFDMLDTNKDGAISREEADAAMKARTDRIEAVDANGDGVVSKEELTKALVDQATRRAERRADRIMERLDANGDGKLGAAEVLAAMGEMGREMRHGMMGGGMMGGGDLFSRLDANDDGMVTKEEAAAMRDRMKGWRRHHDRHDERGHHGWGRHGWSDDEGDRG